MSVEPDRDLRNYVSYLQSVTSQDSADFVDLATVGGRRIGDGQVRPIQLELQTSRRKRPGWLVAAPVLVLLGGWVWLFTSTGSEAPVSDTVVPTMFVDSRPTTVPEAPSARQPLWPGLTEDTPKVSSPAG